MSPAESSEPASTISDLRADLSEQVGQLASLFDETDEPLLTRRPPSGKWSVVEHVDHLVKVNRAYAAALEPAIARGRSKGRRGSGPFRGSMLGRFFARTMEPPVTVRVKTMSDMQPDSTLDPGATLADFTECQDRLDELLQDAEGLDLDRIRMPSPFLRLLRAPVFSWFSVVSAHNRRHIWLVRETLEQVESGGV